MYIQVQEFAAKTRKSEVEDKSSDTAKGHVMISYQWNNQETLIQIKEHLRSNGFKVWMDIDDMAGSTLEAMAKAVEEADVVLLCFSKKYKNNDNCRAGMYGVLSESFFLHYCYVALRPEH